MSKISHLKKLPSSGARQYEQAHFIWNVLAAWVQYRKKELITYGELAIILGYEPQAGRTLAPALGMVSLYCLYNDLPPLSCIVVAKGSKKPGWEGMIPENSTSAKEQKKVWKTNWHLYRTPTAGTFRKVKEELSWNDYI